MYAVVRSGGKQYRVEPGQRGARREAWPARSATRVELGEVLLVGGEGDARVGKPLVAGAKVVGKIVGQGRGPKMMIFKQKRRKNYRRKQGHRQNYTEIRVDGDRGLSRMAHKKGQGSSRNGRDSNSPAPRREGLRRPARARRHDPRAPGRDAHPSRSQRRRRPATSRCSRCATASSSTAESGGRVVARVQD